MLPENEIENFVTERSKAYPFFQQLLFNVEMKKHDMVLKSGEGFSGFCL